MRVCLKAQSASQRKKIYKPCDLHNGYIWMVIRIKVSEDVNALGWKSFKYGCITHCAYSTSLTSDFLNKVFLMSKALNTYNKTLLFSKNALN